MKKFNTKKVAVLGLVGALGVGSAIGVSAFFTDKADITSEASAGNINMGLQNYSDLDGNYRTWADGSNSTSLLAKDGLQDAKFEAAAADAANPSTGLINPGDTGVLQFSLANTGSKSIDTAAIVTVTSSVAFTKDALEYSIPALGTPVVSEDGKTLTYGTAANPIKLDVINGTVETEDGGLTANDEHYYAYNVDFARGSANAFMDADYSVKVDAYAKQHRNTFDTDWAQIGSFEVVQ